MIILRCSLCALPLWHGYDCCLVFCVIVAGMHICMFDDVGGDNSPDVLLSLSVGCDEGKMYLEEICTQYYVCSNACQRSICDSAASPTLASRSWNGSLMHVGSSRNASFSMSALYVTHVYESLPTFRLFDLDRFCWWLAGFWLLDLIQPVCWIDGLMHASFARNLRFLLWAVITWRALKRAALWLGSLHGPRMLAFIQSVCCTLGWTIVHQPEPVLELVLVQHCMTSCIACCVVVSNSCLCCRDDDR